jgi:hypothetical protein
MSADEYSSAVLRWTDFCLEHHMINFAGIEFIFRFLPIFMIIYWIIPSAYQDALLLVGSLIFYASGAK